MIANLNFKTSESQYKSEEINLNRSKVVYLTQAVLEDPNNSSCQALLNLTLARLERLLTA